MYFGKILRSEIGNFRLPSTSKHMNHLQKKITSSQPPPPPHTHTLQTFTDVNSHEQETQLDGNPCT